MFPYLATSNVYHVSKLGNDANSGLASSYPIALGTDAKLTVNGAISAATSGDTIVIWPGTYDENIDLDTANKSLTFIGTERHSCKIIKAASAAHTITLEDDCSFYDLTIGMTGTTVSIWPLGNTGEKDNIIIDNCSLLGTYDGLWIKGSGWHVSNSYIEGAWDGAWITQTAQHCIIENCIFRGLGTWTTGSYIATKGMVVGPCENVLVRNCVISGTAPDGTTRSDTTQAIVAGVYANGTSTKRDCDILFDRCVITSRAEGSAVVTGDICAVSIGKFSGAGSLYGGSARFHACSFETIVDSGVTHTGSAYDIKLITNTGVSSAYLSGCLFDEAKISKDAGSLLYRYAAPYNSSGQVTPDLTSAAIATAILAKTGVTAGGTTTVAEAIEILLAAIAGKVQNKTGVAGTYQYLDVEDGSTPVLEVIPDDSTPYRSSTIL